METHQNDECLLQEAVSRGGPWRAGAWRRSPDRDGSNGARALRTDGSQLRGRYQVPLAPGYSAEMRPQSLARYAYPGGEAWAEARSAG